MIRYVSDWLQSFSRWNLFRLLVLLSWYFCVSVYEHYLRWCLSRCSTRGSNTIVYWNVSNGWMGMCVCMYICVYVCMCMYVLMVYADRKNEQQRERVWKISFISETLMGSNPAFCRGRQLVSFRFEYRLPVPEHRNQQQQTCISPEPGANAKRLWGWVGWILADHRDGLSSSSF